MVTTLILGMQQEDVFLFPVSNNDRQRTVLYKEIKKWNGLTLDIKHLISKTFKYLIEQNTTPLK